GIIDGNTLLRGLIVFEQTPLPSVRDVGWGCRLASQPSDSSLLFAAFGQRRHSKGELSKLAPNAYHQFEADLQDEGDYAARMDNTLGKVVRIDLRNTEAVIFSRGHRNPQGLAFAPDGRLWETEHGPQGGDELNEIIHGGDYGWPHI